MRQPTHVDEVLASQLLPVGILRPWVKNSMWKVVWVGGRYDDAETARAC